MVADIGNTLEHVQKRTLPIIRELLNINLKELTQHKN